MDDPFPQGQSTLNFQTGPVRCERCGHTFAYLAFEEIEGIVQLRCGDLLIPKMEAHCIHCGRRFYYNLREKEVEKMTVTYGTLLKQTGMYIPE